MNKLTLIVRLLVLIGFLLISANVKAQIEDLQVGTLIRKMLVYAPSDIEPNRPLLLSLHGMNQDINYQQNMTRWETIAKANNFVVVYPGGINNSWSLSGTRDIDFILAIIDEMVNRYEIDRNRVYLSGFSMGGMMTYYAATRIADKIAAFAPVSGYLMSGPNTSSSRPVPIIHTHGTTDDVVTFNNVQNHINAWVTRNNCPSTPVTINPYPSGMTNTNTIKSTWGPGTDSVEVVLLRLNGVGHWHSTNHNGVNTSQEIWDFCKRFSLGFGVPKFSSAFIHDDNPSYINVFFSRPIKESATYTGFSVYADNQPVAIDNVVYIGENQLQIRLVNEIVKENELLLSYSNGNVLSVYDKKLVDFSNKIIDNLLLGAPPRIIGLSVTTDGESLLVKLNKKMMLPTDYSELSLKAIYNEEFEIPLLQSSFLEEDFTTLVFSLQERVYADYQLLLSYSGNSIESVDNGFLKDFSDMRVTNNSTGLPVSVIDGQLEANGYIIALKFSKGIRLADNQLTQLVIEVNDQKVSVKEFFVLKNIIRFALTKNLHFGDKIKVSYNPGDIKAADKGLLQAFSNLDVENQLKEPVWRAIPGKIEAEHSNLQFGTNTETTSDTGGGLNVGWTDIGDWLEYAIENNTDITKFNISFRVAAQSSGSSFEYYLNNNRVGVVAVPSTGGWQVWQTVNREINIEKGKHYFKILVVNGGFNINFFQISNITTNQIELNKGTFDIYPNPASEKIIINAPDFTYHKIEIIDLKGKTVMNKFVNYEPELHFPVNLMDGIYAVRLSNSNDAYIRKLIINN